MTMRKVLSAIVSSRPKLACVPFIAALKAVRRKAAGWAASGSGIVLATTETPEGCAPYVTVSGTDSERGIAGLGPRSGLGEETAQPALLSAARVCTATHRESLSSAYQSSTTGHFSLPARYTSNASRSK